MFVCYYRTMILICTVLFYFFFFKSCVFSLPASQFWTSSMPSAALTSNSRFRLPDFGLLPCLPLLQRPIHRFSRSFWTSSVPSSALTSNPRSQLPSFGLLPCLPLLQRPFLASSFPVLDFFRDFHYFNVQSAALSRSFWTSSVPSAALTSNSHF